MTRGIRVTVAAAVCGVLAAFSAGCGGAVGDYTRKDAAAELTRLRGLLRGAPELPEGFSARPHDGWVSPFHAADRDCQLLLDTAAGRSLPRSSGARVAVTYPGDGLGELAGISLVSYPGDGAELNFARLTGALSGCRVAAGSSVGSPAGRSTSFKVSDLELDGLGGDIQARRLRGRLNGYPYEMHMVFALAGHTVVSLVHAGISGVDVDRTRGLARFMLDRAAV